jgi:hypothetical protein
MQQPNLQPLSAFGFYEYLLEKRYGALGCARSCAKPASCLWHQPNYRNHYQHYRGQRLDGHSPQNGCRHRRRIQGCCRKAYRC